MLQVLSLLQHLLAETVYANNAIIVSCHATGQCHVILYTL